MVESEILIPVSRVAYIVIHPPVCLTLPNSHNVADRNRQSEGLAFIESV